jgi:undecaprenyl-diphosphatase
MMRQPITKFMAWVGGHEAASLAGLLPLVVGLWAFLALADEVRERETPRFDDRILRALRRPDDPSKLIGPVWLAEAARDITALGSVPVIALVTAAVVGFLAMDRKFAAMIFVLVATSSGLVMSELLKAAFHRPRPQVVPHLMPAFHSSFPSGHSMMAAVVYLTLGSLLARLLAAPRLKFYVLSAAVVLTVLVGTTRVLMGVHYPSDVLAGWAAGVVWACLCWMVEVRLQRRGTIERPT